MNARVTLWFLVFLGFWINDMFKINMNIVITSMVKEHSTNENYTGRCAINNFTSWYKLTKTISPKLVPLIKQITFEWHEYEQDLILSSFFWIHWVAQLPAAILSYYFGTKVVFGTAILLGAVSNILTPFAAKMGIEALIAVRLFQGFVGGATWPSLPHLTAKWIPMEERAIFLSSYLGGSAGWAITYVLSMHIIDKFGWQYVFYTQSILGVIWCITWKHLVYDDPFQHPSISIKEKAHILNGIRKSGFIDDRKPSIPWKSMLTSGAVWATLIACTGTLWSLFTLIILSSYYLKSSHGLDLKTINIFFSISHIARWLFASTFSIVGKHQKYIPLRNVRKLATSTCTIGTGSMLAVVSLSNCNLIPALAALSLAIISLGVQGAGPVAIFIDMCPNFAGILTGISGSAGALAGLISPIWLDYMIKNNLQQTTIQWQKLFMLTAFICWISGIANLFFGTSELQPWNKKDSSVQQNSSTQTTLLSSKPKKTRVEMISL